MLTTRENEVLQLLFLGKSNRDIGELIGLSPLTVKNHVQKILRRLCAPNRFAACYVALKRGFLDPPPLEPYVEPKPRVVLPPPPPEPLPPPDWLHYETIRVCWETREVFVGEQPVKIERSLFRLLHFLIQNQHRAHSRQTLLDYIHTQDRAIEERTVDVHIRRLRTILAPHGYGDAIETVRGLGYRLRPL